MIKTAVFGFEDLRVETEVKREGDRGGSCCEEEMEKRIRSDG